MIHQQPTHMGIAQQLRTPQEHPRTATPPRSNSNCRKWGTVAPERSYVANKRVQVRNGTHWHGTPATPLMQVTQNSGHNTTTLRRRRGGTSHNTSTFICDCKTTDVGRTRAFMDAEENEILIEIIFFQLDIQSSYCILHLLEFRHKFSPGDGPSCPCHVK